MGNENSKSKEYGENKKVVENFDSFKLFLNKNDSDCNEKKL